MACSYIYKGKTFNEDEFKDHLRSMPVQEASKYIPEVKSIPDMPWRNTWHELALKRMLKYAADNGFDGILVDKGQTVADRYDLSKHVKQIVLEPHWLNGQKIGYKLEAYDHNNNKVIEQYPKTQEQISELIGKEPTQKLFSDENVKRYNQGAGARLSGLDLKIGGEFHKKLYDEKIPQALNKLGKKYGAKVGEGKVQGELGASHRFDITPTNGGGWRVVDNSVNQPYGQFIGGVHKTMDEAKSWIRSQGYGDTSVHKFDITPQMRNAIQQRGFPQFASGGRVTRLTPVNHDPFETQNAIRRAMHGH